MNNDVIELHKKIKEQIAIIEENKNDQEAIHLLTDELFPKLMEEVKLAIISHKESYYGYFFMNLNIDINPYYKGTAAVAIDANPMKMIVNPLTLGKRSIRQIIFIICHEIEHLVLNHPAEGIRMNPRRSEVVGLELNYAMDASINDRLGAESKRMRILEEPYDDVTSEFLSQMLYGTQNKYELEACKDYLYYYNKIKGKMVKVIDDIVLVQLDSQNKDGNSQVVTEDDIKKKKLVVIPTKEDDPSNVEEKIREFAKKVNSSIHEEDRELLPIYQIERLEKLLKPPVINWRSVLRKYVGILPEGYRKTKMRLNRRQPERYDVSGKMSEKTFKIVIAIDTSGSLEKEDLEEIFSEVFSILKNRKYSLTIIECDDEIRRVYTVKSEKDIDMNIKGRGGTSYTPVINYINQHREYRDAVLIYFTDGFGNERIPKPNIYRVLWLITCGEKDLFSLENPYGEVIEMRKEDS